MSIRRPHHKSRFGCERCRQRRVKCGEQKPRCKSCDHRGLECVYRTSVPPPGFGRAFFAAPGFGHMFFAGPPNTVADGPTDAPREAPFEHMFEPPYGPACGPSFQPPFAPTFDNNFNTTFSAAQALDVPVVRRSEDPTSSAETTESSSSSCAASSSSATTFGETPEPTSNDVLTVPRTTELELLHHYQVEGHKSLVHTYRPEAEASSLFRDDIPRLAFSHNFLLDSILAISAFHLAYMERPTEKGANDWITIALHYHQRSVRSLRLTIFANTSDELQKQYTGLLFGATFIAIASFVSMQVPQRASFVDSIRALASMMQGTASIHGLDNGGFEALRGRGKVQENPEDYILEPDIEIALHELRGHAIQQDAIAQCQAWDGSPAFGGTSYADSVRRLRECFVACDRGNEIEGGTAWPALRQPNFTSHIELQDPVSHLIVLVLGVLWSFLHQRWWARHVGKCAVEEMSSMEMLKDKRYQNLVMWARRRVGLAVW